MNNSVRAGAQCVTFRLGFLLRPDRGGWPAGRDARDEQRARISRRSMGVVLGSLPTTHEFGLISACVTAESRAGLAPRAPSH